DGRRGCVLVELPANRRAPQGHCLRPARATFSGVPPRPVRRVQLALRPGDGLRAEDERAGGIDPDVAAAGGALLVRLPTGARFEGGGADRVLVEAAGLGGDGVTHGPI